MSSPPTIYFPDYVDYELVPKPGRLWNNTLTKGPTRRRQLRSLQLRPQRLYSGTVFISDLRNTAYAPADFQQTTASAGPGPPMSRDEWWAVTIKPFLDSIVGMKNPFYIFDPAPRAFYRERVGPWNGAGLPLPIDPSTDLPFTLPFRGTEVSSGGGTGAIQAFNVAEITFIVMSSYPTGPVYQIPPANFTLGVDSITGHGATKVEALFDPSTGIDPLPSGDYIMQISGRNLHERIPAVMTSDLEATAYNPANATPFAELPFSCEEWFG